LLDSVEKTSEVKSVIGLILNSRIIKTDESIEKILVSGGAYRIPGFLKYMEQETGIPVEELNPFANLQINEKVFDPRYLSYIAPQAGVAVGLALRSAGDK